MHAIVTSNLIKEAINKVITVVDRKNTRPILAYTLVEARDNKLSFSATDMEVSARIEIDANIKSPGTFCLNAKNFFDILKELPSTEIELFIDVNENSLKINCGDIHFSLLVFKNEDFPHLIFGNKENEFHIDSGKVLEIISKTNHAISNDETRLFLNGIYLQEVDNKLRAVATDGHRLSMIDTELEVSGNESLKNGIIVPRKGISELKKLAESNAAHEVITISVDESFIYVKSDEKYFLSIRLISREYPKYQAVIPQKTSSKLIADKSTLLDAVKRIKVMSNEKSNGVRAEITAQGVTITANHPSLGDAREKILGQYDGKEIEIGFNAKYLLETLTTFDDGDITIEINNELSPVLIKSVQHPNYLGVIMPLKL
jgi:DNA polymerase-3 subunit beta